jgi:broad-specificity NMP kinase
VIVLNGPSGVGKTTVGRLLAARVRNGACVHGDALRDFVVSRVDDEVQLGLGYVNAAAVAANFVRAGYERVVVDYVFEAPRHVAQFVDAFDVDADLHVVTLWTSREALAERGGSADGRARMEPALAELGEVVDTTGRSPDEVAAAIEALL